MMHKEVRIAVCGLINSPNLGERFISDSLEFIIRDEYKKRYGSDSDLMIEQIDIQIDKYNDISNKGLFDFLNEFLRKAARHLPLMILRNICYLCRHLIWLCGRNYKRKYAPIFERQLKDADVIIVDGAGLLEYSYNEYQEALLLISEIAEKYDLPIIYNAIGTVGDYDARDYRCRIMTKALRSSNIVYVSTRDSLDIVQAYLGNRIKAVQCADAAVLLNEAYQISANDSGIVGVGLIRGGALWSYHYDFNREDWISLFASIGNELLKRGYKFRYFTNGLVSDYSLGEEVIKRMNLSDEYLIERPEDPRVLADTISHFSVMITCRMHSMIAGFSMGIPAVVLSWNKKLDKFMSLANHSERAVRVDNFNAEHIVDLMDDALREGYERDDLFRIKQMARNSVIGYIDIIHSKVKAKQ